MPGPKSRLERMARVLNRAAIVLLVLFVGAAIGAVQYVDTEFEGNVSVFRYLLTIATAAPLLVAAIVAWVGSVIVRALGRVRGSLLDALLRDEEDPPEQLAPGSDLTPIGR
ncbi:MAG: hypothetical protein WEE69_14930 [Acidimicrobiia bacterium]